MSGFPSVLFVCTGNYYRSRYAESYFRHLAARAGLGWTTDSLGLDIDNPSNVGPLSRHATAALDKLGVAYELRAPRSLTTAGLRRASVRIAVDREEHRPLFLRRFPAWVDDVEFWRIEDIDRRPPSDALVRLRGEVDGLVLRLLDERVQAGVW